MTEAQRPAPGPIATIGYARRPPRHRRWMATGGDNMALGNISLARALWFCIVETLRGHGPCYCSRFPTRAPWQDAADRRALR